MDDGASFILNKIQGVSHGGGVQVPAGSEAFAQMERFLGRLDAGATSTTAITVDTLFDPVRMAPLRKTLRRAALIFAGGYRRRKSTPRSMPALRRCAPPSAAS